MYLATISTSWPRSKGICTFTSAAPKASWDRDRGNRHLERRPYHPLPSSDFAFSSPIIEPCLVHIVAARVVTEVPQVESSSPDLQPPRVLISPKLSPSAQVILMPQSLGNPCCFHKAGMLSLCKVGLELPRPLPA